MLNIKNIEFISEDKTKFILANLEEEKDGKFRAVFRIEDEEGNFHETASIFSFTEKSYNEFFCFFHRVKTMLELLNSTNKNK